MSAGSLSPQPSSSQSLHNPGLFVDHAGTPLRIFVDSNGIKHDRPKLIKALRNNGANICVDVSLARIILVDPNSSQGRQFVRDWGMDPGKVVLEVAWAQRCIEVGRAMLENDAWGGCGNLDGTPIEDDAVEDVEEGFFTHSRAIGLNGGASNASPRTPKGPVTANGTNPSALSTPRPTPIERYSSSVSSTVQANGTSFSQEQPIASTQVSIQPSPYPQQLLSNHTPMPISMPPNMVQTYGQVVPALDPHMIQAYFMSRPEVWNMMHAMQQNGPFMPQGWLAPPGFMPPQAYPAMIQPAVSMPPQTISHEQYTGPPADVSEPLSVKVEPQSPPRPTSPLPTFTPVSDNESDNLSPSRDQSILLQRGKKRRRETHAERLPRRAERSPSPSYSKKRSKGRADLPTDEEHESERGDTKSAGGIFTKRGKAMTFWIQVQLRNRKAFLKMVKDHGGKLLTDSPLTADFIILDTCTGKERDHWLKVVETSKRFALRSGFIEACINAKGLVEEEDFIIEPPEKSKPNRASSSRKKRKETSPRRSRFTSEEIKYAFDLAGELYRENPNIPARQIGLELEQREPRHPATSWMNILTKDKQKLARIRDGILNEKGDAAANVVSSGSEPEVEAQLAEPSEPETSAAASNSAPEWLLKERSDGDVAVDSKAPNSLVNETTPHSTDLTTIVDFFANPPEGMDDDALWAAITQKHKCLTAASWQDFYAGNMDAVNKLLSEALGIKSDS